jgi:prepilin-type N-terminal cleavage/methylation domain-containing protein
MTLTTGRDKTPQALPVRVPRAACPPVRRPTAPDRVPRAACPPVRRPRSTGWQAASDTRSKGFTLLELIVVLGVVGVLLGMAAPSLKNFMKARQTANAAGQMLSLTQLASSRAAAQGSLYRLNFDDKNGEYWLTVQQGGEFVDIPSEFGRHFTLPEGATVALVRPTGVEATPYIEFRPNGRSEEVTIEIRGRQGETYQLVCQSATETFHIESPNENART